MTVTERSAIVKSSPSKIWKTCFADMKWEQWDPDLEGLQDVVHPNGKLATGTTFTFVMKDGVKMPVKLTEVTDEKSFTLGGAMFYGMMKPHMQIELLDNPDSVAQNTSSEEHQESTLVKYTFGLCGMLGSVFGWRNMKAIIEGTEKGLENIKKMSEESK